MNFKELVESHKPEEIEAFMKVFRLVQASNGADSVDDAFASIKYFVAKREEREAQNALVSSFVSALKGSYEHLGNGEVYVCTGDAEGIVVKVIRRGRKVNPSSG
jgi:hypothetical protein